MTYRSKNWWKRMCDRQADVARAANRQSVEWKHELEALQARVASYAELHSKAVAESEPIDRSPRTRYFCAECDTIWPCPSYRWATGKDFAPLRLQLNPVPKE